LYLIGLSDAGKIKNPGGFRKMVVEIACKRDGTVVSRCRCIRKKT
jgi:hypothetical protein